MLTIENIHKSYGDKVLFENISYTITEHDRIGLIGVNGTGKSSFLKVIAGLDSPDAGSIQYPKDYRIEYLPQEAELDPNLSVIEQIYYGEAAIMKVMREYEKALQKLELDPENTKVQEALMRVQQRMDELEAWEANTTAKTILTKLGITDFNKKVTELSGGQRKRIAIAKALIQPADLLILDEPTNHLDNETVEWLEKYLQSFKGALLLVTHDRYFLNRVTNKIIELDKGNLYSYEGNYEIFLEKKAEREELERSNQQKHANILKRELAWLKAGVKARTTKQKARIDRVHEMKEKTFHTDQNNVEFQVGSTRLGKKVIELVDIAKTTEGKQLIQHFSQLIIPGDRIGIIGPNGSGKTTLLNVMAKRLLPDHGEVIIGDTVKIGYYTQGEEELDGEMRVVDFIKETAEVIHTKEGDVITAEQMLERFLFPRSEQYNYIRKLSGGEKRRLYLLKVLMTEPNVLFLDEPTNDLDIQTLGVLEEYLDHFPGVVITVSHDRYFLDRVVEKLLIFEGKGKISPFYGNYSEYLEKHQVTAKREVRETKAEQKPKQKKKLSYMEQKEWNEIEDQIAALEEKITELEAGILEAGSDSEKVQKLFAEQQRVEEELNKKMERWEELSILVEEYKNK
ncbi:ABC-F family ATP-binding cassette domain-containing protein [Ornithinibacillus sp. BX22]|uniref:ABC-F family ATP-binding cassette domain-containing protein n=2 Tax=Ornithinibacillus TaxID=484508 RepID=A0A923L471_9BACI|nr:MULTISPECIES: ABC-F family ATP-binding cassette domain-containing protein [Ornithinibacillus]MBC5636189.1 ABC-F family ATP-binding cassette domain-containing protein [Ornithinibacillus hominis]MBS3681029.1 ABC-F family ATP-binding cassette domain-containing protein [Ornithinibacillus massiliensis]